MSMNGQSQLGISAFLLFTALTFRSQSVAELGDLTATFTIDHPFALHGCSVATDGNLAAVGACRGQLNGVFSGAVYLYEAPSGKLIGTLVADDQQAGASLGGSLDFHGNFLIAGAIGARDGLGATTVVNGGAAYVFNIDTREQVFRLEPEVPQHFDWFGRSVAINDQFAVVTAAPLRDSVFVFDADTGEQLHEVHVPSLRSNEHAVGIAGSKVIAGVRGQNHDAGQAVVIDATTGQELRRLTIGDAIREDGFGGSVAIQGNLAIVGAPGRAPNGAAFVFDVNTGQQLFELGTDDLAIEPDVTAFGTSVDLDGERAIVSGVAQGRAYVFDLRTGREIVNLVSIDSAEDDQFGADVAIGGQVALVGAPTNTRADLRSGAAFLFEVGTFLRAGDADMDSDFDQRDLVQVQIAAKYLTGQAATWGEGDWNGAPGGSPGNPPVGDGMFNQLDIVAAQRAGIYLTGAYAAVRPGGRYAAIQPNGEANDRQTSIVYDPETGDLSVDVPASTELTSILVESASGILTGPENGPPRHCLVFECPDKEFRIFQSNFGSTFGSFDFGKVAQSGLTEDFLVDDLTVVGSLHGGGALGDVDLIYVPEPLTALTLILGTLAVFARRRGLHSVG